MRTRFILVAVVSLLFCSLSTLETPELVKLADDTSNDFSIMIHHQETTESICNPGPIARLRVSRPRPVLDRTPIQLGSISSSRFAPDLLHFLCIQRT
jgi:hypothetical protein